MPDKFDPFVPCLHCAIEELIYARHDHGIEDDITEIIGRLCESVAEVCATSDAKDERDEYLALASSMIDMMFEDVKNFRWKGDHAGPDQTNH
jgi:hypothetical protein